MKKLHLYATAALLLAGGVAMSQETVAPKAQSYEPTRISLEGEARPMSLADVVLMAFDRNLDLEVRVLDERIEGSRITQAQGIYDPTLEGGLRYEEVKAESTTGVQQIDPLTGAPIPGVDPERLFVTNQESLRGEMNLTQLLPTGATIYTGYTSLRTVIEDSRAFGNTLTPSVVDRAYIGIRQPLLKNFGPKVTNANIRVAEKQRRIANLLYQQEVNDRLADVMIAYWDLVFAQRNLEVQRTSLDAATELERVNRVKVENGALARAELLRASARVADRRNNVINAKSQIIDTQDRLFRLLNWQETGNTWNTPIAPTDKPDKYDLALTLDDDSAVAEALTSRPDYAATGVSVEVAKLLSDVARWQRLPELNLIAEAGSNGVDENRSDAFDDVGDRDYLDYMVGAEFRYPLLNRRARGEARQRNLELERAQVTQRQSELTLVTEVRGATRSVRTAQESIEASQAQVDSARESLNAEQKRLEVGSSTTFDVLEAQEQLVAAEVNLINAQVNYQKGLIDLHRSKGTLVTQIGREIGVQIEFEEDPATGSKSSDAAEKADAAPADKKDES